MVFLIVMFTGDFPGYQAKDKGCKAAHAVQSQHNKFPFQSCRRSLMAQGILQKSGENRECNKFGADADDSKGVVNCSVSISQDSKTLCCPSGGTERTTPPACWINLVLAFPTSPPPGQGQDGEIQSTMRMQRKVPRKQNKTKQNTNPRQEQPCRNPQADRLHYIPQAAALPRQGGQT